MLTQKKLLIQTVDGLTKQLSKLPQQQKQIYKMPNQRKDGFYELCGDNHPIEFCPPTDKVNYVGNKQRSGQYQKYKF